MEKEISVDDPLQAILILQSADRRTFEMFRANKRLKIKDNEQKKSFDEYASNVRLQMRKDHRTIRENAKLSADITEQFNFTAMMKKNAYFMLNT